MDGAFTWYGLIEFHMSIVMRRDCTRNHGNDQTVYKSHKQTQTRTRAPTQNP